MDHDLVTTHRNTIFRFPKLGEGAVTSRDQNSSAFPQFFINFNFTFEQISFDYVSDPDFIDPQFVGQVNEPLLRNTVRVNLQQFMRIQETRETIGEELKNWPMEDNDRPNFIKMAVKETQKLIQSMPPHHNVLDIHLPVIEFRSTFYCVMIHDQLMEESEESEEEEELEEEEESCCFMVPAMNSCVESLERKIINGGCGRNQNCTICLEEYPSGSEVISMPCSHIFHGDCIKNWLRTSHYCPLCRFEMPMS